MEKYVYAEVLLRSSETGQDTLAHTYQHDGKTYVQAESGATFKVRVHNRWNTTLYVGLYVDGVDTDGNRSVTAVKPGSSYTFSAITRVNGDKEHIYDLEFGSVAVVPAPSDSGAAAASAAAEPVLTQSEFEQLGDIGVRVYEAAICTCGKPHVRKLSKKAHNELRNKAACSESKKTAIGALHAKHGELRGVRELSARRSKSKPCPGRHRGNFIGTHSIKYMSEAALELRGIKEAPPQKNITFISLVEDENPFKKNKKSSKSNELTFCDLTEEEPVWTVKKLPPPKTVNVNDEDDEDSEDADRVEAAT